MYLGYGNENLDKSWTWKYYKTNKTCKYYKNTENFDNKITHYSTIYKKKKTSKIR